jgi:hypothetical protein
MSPAVEAAIIAGSVGVLTLIGTLAAQYYGIRRTSKDTLNARFATAADKLGSEAPAVRLTGVYAMAGLADDWPENRQTCVNVLCGYLRMPYEPPGEKAQVPKRLAFRANSEVRHTVIRVITAHLQADAAVSWQLLNFDFTGAVFDGGDFTAAKFTGDTIDFSGAEFSGGTVDFTGAKFYSGVVYFGATFSSGTVNFAQAEFSGTVIWVSRAAFSGGTIDFTSVAKWSRPPTFDFDRDGPPRGVKLPSRVRGAFQKRPVYGHMITRTRPRLARRSGIAGGRVRAPEPARARVTRPPRWNGLERWEYCVGEVGLGQVRTR